MASVLAIVSKAVFEKEAPQALGEVWATKGYASKHATLEVLRDGDESAIFLVTVRPPDERLWLVGILESPKSGPKGWNAAPNPTAMRDITALKAKLGITAKKGVLGMSLQTPRKLTDDDVALLRGAPAVAAGKPAVAPKSTKAAAASTSAKPAAAAMAKERTRPPTAKLVAMFRPATGGAAAGDDVAAAVAALLPLWRSTRAPAIGDVLDAIGARTPSTAPAAKGSAKETIPAWSKWAKTMRDVDVPAAIATFDAARIQSKPARARLELVGKRAPDPRIGRFLVGLLADPPFQSTGTQPFWRRLFALLPPHLDAQTLAALTELVGGGVRRVGAKTMGEWFDKELGKLVAATTVPPPSGAFDPKPWLARFAAPRADDRRAELFAAVYAAPADDAPRAVLADYLQEHGEPHGELIALQLAAPGPERDARVAELVKRGKDLVPAVIAKVVKDQQFERGFLAGGRLDPRTGGELRRAVGAAGWETVRVLHLGHFDERDDHEIAARHELLVAPAMRHLETLWTSADIVIRLGKRGGPFPIRTLAIWAHSFGDWSDEAPGSDGLYTERAAALGEALVRDRFPSLDQLVIKVGRVDERAAPGTVALIEQVPWLAARQLTVGFELPAGAKARLKSLGVKRLAIEPGLTVPFEEE